MGLDLDLHQRPVGECNHPRVLSKAGCGVFLLVGLVVVLALWFGGCLKKPTQMQESPHDSLVASGPQAEGAGKAAGGIPSDIPGVCPIVDGVLLGDLLTIPTLCGSQGVLVGTNANALGVRATWEVEAELVDAAADVLESYRSLGNAVLEHDGYLDLLGNVWSCAVSFPEGWVELVFVDGRNGRSEIGAEEEDGACKVTVVRLGQKAVE